ncbi:hypothetical protein GCM10011380_04350 [Sphingomonas metalli]|uniref:Uncharacterized protein n=1 Tax=Sphingomonas metalli TaxID=1779358 RepID=A0A916SXA2_9SPHN|nr:hypothetical protein [Sphingomonas metalli]GGB17936.1 hypothetical protein GCM10011380_04350 [Sphingomonas metalli]
MSFEPLDEAAIARIATGLLSATLPKAEWTHAAHFAAALWILRHRPDAADAMPDVIRTYNVATGGVNSDMAGYHETITRASMRVAARWLAGYPEERPLADILAALLDSPYGRSDWLLAHWSRERLFGAEARRRWVEPDLTPLPA